MGGGRLISSYPRRCPPIFWLWWGGGGGAGGRGEGGGEPPKPSNPTNLFSHSNKQFLYFLFWTELKNINNLRKN